jgi:hypothetical protein
MNDNRIQDTHVWTKDEIYTNIMIHYRWLTAAVLTLYQCQTKEERQKQITIEHNRQGYNGIDAPFMSSLAHWIQSGRELSEKQQKAARRVLRKYAGQLTKIANSHTEQKG